MEDWKEGLILVTLWTSFALDPRYLKISTASTQTLPPIVRVIDTTVANNAYIYINVNHIWTVSKRPDRVLIIMSKGGIFVEMFIVSLSPANYYKQFFCLEYGDSVPLRLSWLSTSATLWMEIKDIRNENTNRNILKYCRFWVLLPPQTAVLEQLVATMIEKASNWNQILKQSWFSKKSLFNKLHCVFKMGMSHTKECSSLS